MFPKVGTTLGLRAYVPLVLEGFASILIRARSGNYIRGTHGITSFFATIQQNLVCRLGAIFCLYGGACFPICVGLCLVLALGYDGGTGTFGLEVAHHFTVLCR